MSPRHYVLRQAAELEAVVSPVRHHLLRTLSVLGPSSVKELARDMGRSPESLYYHLRALVDAGLVVEHGERSVNGRSEALFRTIAPQLVTDAEASDPEYLDAYRRSASALLRLADRQLTTAIQEQEDTGSKRPVSLRIQQLQARLSRRDQRELARRLDSVLEFLSSADDPAQTERIVVTLVSAPL